MFNRNACTCSFCQICRCYFPSSFPTTIPDRDALVLDEVYKLQVRVKEVEEWIRKNEIIIIKDNHSSLIKAHEEISKVKDKQSGEFNLLKDKIEKLEIIISELDNSSWLRFSFIDSRLNKIINKTNNDKK